MSKFSSKILVFLLIFIGSISGVEAQGGGTFPVISRLDPTDTTFRQFINDVQNNRRRLFQPHIGTVEEIAGHLTIYQYTPRPGEDLLFLAARTNIPYSALATLNRLPSPNELIEGRPILLPSSPGIFLPAGMESDLEKLLGAERLYQQPSVQLRINVAGRPVTYHFFPGADFTPTERAFFLNPGFRFPLRNFRLTSGFGTRICPINERYAMHRGIDLAAPPGTEVFAAGEGTVTRIGYNAVYGNYIVISHRNNMSSFYAHLQRVETTLHAAVNSTTLIGRVGSTGLSTGPHLHFELRRDGTAIDPSGRLRR